MNVCVFGLWHLGCVTAACVAEHFPTVGLDPNPATIADLNAANPPILEPGLRELIQAGLSTGMLRFTSDIPDALAAADIVWIAIDTPVNENDVADTAYVDAAIGSLLPHLRSGSTVLISSQMPVGSTTRTEAAYRKRYSERDLGFAYSPENLRLGKALDAFRKPERIVIGTRRAEDRERLTNLLRPFCNNLVWMSVESAEMTKHALNAFLANSIVFINELAAICEATGADAKEVESGLKTDVRIGPRAYLTAGAAFAGGTLARDVTFLVSTAKALSLPAHLLQSISQSNELHKQWPRRKLQSLLGDLPFKNVTVLGLTYKPGTDTLRRSAAVELCRWLSGQHVKVTAYDPVIRELPPELSRSITLQGSAIMAVKDSDAVVVATEWPQFRELTARDLIANMRTPIVLDPNRFLENALASSPPLRYIAVGMQKESA